MIPFFSRRIGLLGGREVPLDAGVKIAGREGSTNFGALVVRTGNVDTLPTENAMGVFRLKQNVLHESSVGVIATLGDPLGRAGSWTAGTDLTYQTSRFQGNRNFLVGVWGLATGRDDLPGTQHAFGTKIDYPNDLWDVAFTFKRVDSLFDPSLGFVQRPGAQLLTLNITNTPRPKRPILGLRVRQMTNEWFNTLATDLNGRWESYRDLSRADELATRERRSVRGQRGTDRRATRAPFEIAEGVVIRPAATTGTAIGSKHSSRRSGGSAVSSPGGSATSIRARSMSSSPRRHGNRRRCSSWSSTRRATSAGWLRATSRSRSRDTRAPERLARPAVQQLHAVRQHHQQLRDEYARSVDVLAVRRTVRRLQPQHPRS